MRLGGGFWFDFFFHVSSFFPFFSEFLYHDGDNLLKSKKCGYTYTMSVSSVNVLYVRSAISFKPVGGHFAAKLAYFVLNKGDSKI